MFYYMKFNDPDFRSKWEYPYSYSPICVFDSGKQSNHSLYSDRLVGWYGYEVVQAAMTKHFGNCQDYYADRSIESIENFLRDLLNQR